MSEPSLDIDAHAAPSVPVRVEWLLQQVIQPPPAGVQLMPTRSAAAFTLLEARLLMFEASALGTRYPDSFPPVCRWLSDWLAETGHILFLTASEWNTFCWMDAVFDHVISDAKLSGESAWLLDRLRLPFLHYALKQPGFFLARNDLCRRFLDDLVGHLVSTRDPHAREVTFVLGGITSRVLELFRGDVASLHRLCLEAQQWFAIQHQRSAQLHERLRERILMEKRRQTADRRVTDLLESAFSGKTLPDVLVKFMRTDWRDVLLKLAVRDGPSGAQWERGERITRAMPEICVRCDSPEAREKYEPVVESLIRAMNGLLGSAAADPSLTTRVNRSVERIYSAVLLNSVGRLVTLDTYSPTGFIDPPQDDPIEGLEEGGWVRFRVKGGQYEVCSLIMTGDAKTPWVFVNQSGAAVVSKRRDEILILLRDGIMELLGHWRPFDRALLQHVRRVGARVPMPETEHSAIPGFDALPVARAVELYPDVPLLEPKVSDTAAEDRGENDSNVVTVWADDEPDDDTNAVDAENALDVGTAVVADEVLDADKAPDADDVLDADKPLEQVSMPQQDNPPEAVDFVPEAGSDPIPDTVAVDSGDILTQEGAVIQETPVAPSVQAAVTDSAGVPDAVMSPTDTVSDEALAIARETTDGLEIGARLTWYGSGGEEIALKLGVRVRVTGKLVFVNRAGLKQLEGDREAIARLIALGELSVVDAGNRFESALERVVKQMQRDK